MLTLVLGRSGSGKSEYLFNAAAEMASKGVKRQIFLVPETHSHVSERRLCEIGGDSISCYCEVLTFRRLMNRVFSDLGGLAESVLDDGGRILLMHEAYGNAREVLRCYDGDADTKLLKNLVDVVDELKSCRISDEMLLAAAKDCDHPLDTKLMDIVAIRSAYDSLTENGAHDPRDMMTRLADTLHASTWFDGREIYIDGFTGFTPQELSVLEAMRRANVTAAFTCDGLNDDDELFSKSVSSARRLIRIFDGEAEVKSLSVPPRSDDLAYIEKSLFSYSAHAFDGECTHVELRPSAGIMAECERAAARILELMRGGTRCRDIALVCGDYESYALAIETALDRYDIPYYVTRQTDLAVKPVTALIMRALKIASRGFRHEDVMAYIKTGLAGLDINESSALENYCLLWHIRPSQWTSDADWNMNPKGFGVAFDDSTLELLENINGLRRRVREPLIRLADGIRRNGEASGKIRALYDFITEISLPEAIEARASELDALAKYSESDEYSQLWSILCACLDSFMNIAADRVIDANEFCELFTLVLSGSDIGTIPPSVDRVICGGFSRLRPSSLKAVFVLGGNDGLMPFVGESGALLTDYDRDVLDTYDIELAYTSDSRTAESLEEVYMALSKPRELLYISWSETDSSGSNLRPSWLVQRLIALMPAAVRRDDDDGWRYANRNTAIDYSMSHADPAALAVRTMLSRREDTAAEMAELSRRAALPEERINDASVTGLYGERLRLTSSRIDKFNTCRFSYYSRYGLGLDARRPAAMDAPQTGTYFHFVLENTVRDVQNAGGFKNVSLDEIKETARGYTLEYIRDRIPDFNEKTPRFRYLFARLQTSLDAVITGMYNEFSVSEFMPLDFELSFGHDMPPVNVRAGDVSASLTGVVDRIDGWVCDGVLYLRVVDYKSGSKTFSFGELSIGLGMQMPIYLFALKHSAERYIARHRELGADDIIPAGLLYSSAKIKPFSADRDIDDEELTAKLEKEMVHSGVVLDDMKVIDAMESGINGNGRFIPVEIKTNKKGETTVKGTATEEEFALLEEHLERMLRTTAQIMREGHIETDPLVNHSRLTCEFCDYRQFCFFDRNEDSGKIRYPRNVTQKAFFEKLREGK